MSITNYGFQLAFDGVDESVRCGQLTLDPTGPSVAKAYSRAMWAKMSNIDIGILRNQYIWSCKDAASRSDGFMFAMDSVYRAESTGMGGIDIQDATQLDDEWHFFGLTLIDNYDDPRVYQLRGYFDNTGPFLLDQSDIPLFIMNWQGAPSDETFGESVEASETNRNFNGYIGQSAFWDNFQLTDADMLTLYAGGNRFSDWSTMESDDLLAYWKMGNGTNTDGSPKDTSSTIYDNKSSYNGTTENMTSSNLERIDNPSFVAPYQPFWKSNDETSNDNSGYFFGNAGDNAVSTNAP